MWAWRQRRWLRGNEHGSEVAQLGSGEEEEGEEERKRQNLGRGEGKRGVVIGQPGRGRPALLASLTACGGEPGVRNRVRVRGG